MRDASTVGTHPVGGRQPAYRRERGGPCVPVRLEYQEIRDGQLVQRAVAVCGHRTQVVAEGEVAAIP